MSNILESFRMDCLNWVRWCLLLSIIKYGVGMFRQLCLNFHIWVDSLDTLYNNVYIALHLNAICHMPDCHICHKCHIWHICHILWYDIHEIQVCHYGCQKKRNEGMQKEKYLVSRINSVLGLKNAKLKLGCQFRFFLFVHKLIRWAGIWIFEFFDTP